MNVIAPERDLPASHLEWLKLLFCYEFAFWTKAMSLPRARSSGGFQTALSGMAAEDTEAA